MRALFHLIARYTLSLIGGFAWGIMVGLSATLIGALIPLFFRAPLIPVAFYSAVICGSIGFCFGAYKGAKYISDSYKYYLAKANATSRMREITQLIPAEKLQFLDDNELQAFKGNAKHNEFKLQLDNYESYTQDNCGITLIPIADLEDAATIEGINEEKRWTRTYDRTSLLAWIDVRKLDVTEPVMGFSLLDKKIKVYSGFPTWIKEFISTVRSILAISSDAQIFNELKGSSPLKNLPKPQLDFAPTRPIENKYEKKEAVALQRRRFYERHKEISTPVELESLNNHKAHVV